MKIGVSEHLGQGVIEFFESGKVHQTQVSLWSTLQRAEVKDEEFEKAKNFAKSRNVKIFPFIEGEKQTDENPVDKNEKTDTVSA